MPEITTQTRRRRQYWAMLATAILTLLSVAGINVATAQQASANSILCSGTSYSACTGLGYTDHGFGAHYTTSYWRTVAGHDCTNYVAYVEQTVNGAPDPGYLLGNASDWDNNASAHNVPVNGNVAPGAVAQWESSRPDRTSGHVAYIEAVNADGSITVSQDNYPSGPYSWEVISPGSPNWPDHIIHFKDLPATSSVRTAFVADQGAVFRTDDTGNWQTITDASGNPTAVSVSGSRMGIINSAGAFYRVNDSSPWVQIVDSSLHPKAIAVSDSGRMAFIADQGALFRVNDNSPWQTLSGPSALPTAISVSATRVGLVNGASGALYRLSDTSPWIEVTAPSLHPVAIAVSG